MRKVSVRLVAICGLVALWQVVAWLNIWPHYLFPTPADVAVTIWRLVASGEMAVGVVTTLRRILLGFGLAAAGGLLLGVAMTRYKWLAELAGPVAQGLQSMPSICWFPLAILWLGLNEGAVLFVTIVGTLFAVAASTDAGIRTISPGYLRAAATMGAGGIRLYTRVIFPAALPSILTGLRVGWSFAWRSLMAAELLFMNLGLGHLLNMGRELADASQVVAVIVVILVMGVIVDRLVFARAESALRQRWGFERAA